MTARKKLAMEMPSAICAEQPGGCWCRNSLVPSEENCTACWDREISESQDEVNEDFKLAKKIDEQTLKELEAGTITLNEARKRTGLSKMKDPSSDNLTRFVLKLLVDCIKDGKHSVSVRIDDNDISMSFYPVDDSMEEET